MAVLQQLDQEQSASKKRSLTTKTGVAHSFKSDLHRNDALRLNLNDESSTPGDVLHILLLGVVKALVRLGYGLCTKNKRCAASRHRLAAWLDSTNFNGADHKISGAAMRHCGSWVGRDFRAILDVLPLIFRQVNVDNATNTLTRPAPARDRRKPRRNVCIQSAPC